MTKKKTLLCLLLALIMIVSVLPARRSAKADVPDGYYLIRPDWTIDALGGKFTANPNAEGEYLLQTTVSEGQKIKVVHVQNGAIDAWYPDGLNNEYTVQGDCPTGSVTIFFRAAYFAEWSSTGGYFYIVKNYAVTCAEATGGTVSADYTQASYYTTVTLTVTPEEGYRIGSVSYNDGSDHVITPDEDGYHFTMPEHDVTVTATFTAVNTITVNVLGDASKIGYTLTDFTTNTIITDNKIPVGHQLKLTVTKNGVQEVVLNVSYTKENGNSENYEDEGYEFINNGYTSTVLGLGPVTITLIVDPIWLTLNGNGGVDADNQTEQYPRVPKDTDSAIPENPFTYEGHTFTGWNTEANGDGTPYADGAMINISEETTLYAQWEEELPRNTITVNVLGDASKIGYTLKDVTTNTPVTDNTIPVGHQLSLKFSWRGAEKLSVSPTYTRYDGVEMSESMTFQKQDMSLLLPELGSGPVTITLIVDPVTLTLDGNGGKGPHDENTMEQLVVPNTVTAIRANEFTNAGYAFAGWNTEANGSGTPYADGATINVSGDTTLYAQWEELPKSTITVNVIGDASKISYTLTDLTTNTEITDNMITVGHELRIRMYPVSESITLVFKVVWTDSEGEVHVRDYLSPVLLSNPTSFIAWSDGIGSGPVTVTIFVNPIKLTLDGNGGITEDEESTVADWFPANYDAEIPGNPFTYEGHIFIGWKDGSGTPVGGTINIPEDTTLYAQWQSFYTITVNNGTADKAAASAGETVTITANEPESGMAFVEWAQVDGVTYQNGASVETTFTMPEKDVTLTAVYAPIIIEEIDSRIYTGLPIEPDDISVYLDGVDLFLTDEDYDLEFQSNVDAGTATVTVTMTAPRAGSASATFRITPASISNAIVTAENRTADGTEQTPEPTVIWNDQVLEKGKDYEIDSYADNVQPGTATVTVKGKGNFVGTVSGTFEIAAPIAYTVTVTNDGNGTAGANPASGTTGQEVTLSASPSEGYQFKEWQVLSGGVTIADNKFTIGTANVEIKAIFEEIKNTETESPEPTATDEPVYEITEGKDGSWTKLSNKTYRVVVKRVGDDENCFAHFSGVSIDGKALVLNTDFTAEKGSTVITIKVETLETLKVGDHTLTVQFDDGTVETTLKVVRNYDAEPGTGDRTHPALWFGVMSVCAVGLLTLLVFAAKRRREDY